MKHEKWLICATAAVMAFPLAYGTVGAMVTAFDLSAVNMGTLLFICISAAILSAVCFTVKKGGLILLGLTALAVGFLWRDGEALKQTFSLLRQISEFYDGGYGWGVFSYGSPTGRVNYPIGILGCLVAVTASWSVCRGQSLWPTTAAVLVPLCACCVVTDTVPEASYLYLILLPFLLLVMTNTVRRKNAQQGFALTGIVAIPLAACLGLLFWLAPRDSYVNRAPDILQQAQDLAVRVPELWEEMTEQVNADIANDRAEAVDLKDLGPRPELTYEVMTVFGTVEGPLYLRGQDFILYSGTGWTAGGQTPESFPASTEHTVSAGAVTIETNRTRNVLYLPYYPSVPVTMSGSAYNQEQQKRYVFARCAPVSGWEALSYRADDDVSLEVTKRDQDARQQYLYLPESTKQWGKALTAEIIHSDMTRTQQANAIAAYVRQSAEYDLNTGKMPSEQGDFARWFLEESDTGYCVHFATATAVLLRAAGIPSRYVTGYMLYAEAGKTVTVNASHAHAWVEYYEPALDLWMVLEATPAAQHPPETTAPTQPAESTGPAPTETDPSPTETQPPTEPALPTTAEETQPPDSQPPDETPPERKPSFGWLFRLLIWLLTAAAIIGAVPAQRRLRLFLRQKRRSGLEPNALALLYWHDALQRGRLLGKKPPRSLERLAQKAKFSQHTLTEEELSRLRGFIAEAEAELAVRPWYWQLLLRYVLAIY